MSEIHNTKKRMPIILNEEREKDWLAKKDISLFSNENNDLKATPV